MIPTDYKIVLVDIEPPNWKPNFKQLYIEAGSFGWTREGIHNLIELNFKKSSTKDLTFVEYNKVMEWIEKLPPNSVTVERDANTEDLFSI
jgi:hypothetical protein